jgi:hypothetical protein
VALVSACPNPATIGGDCLPYVERGPITVILPDAHEAFDVQVEGAMFVPEGVRYQLINYTSGLVGAIFTIAPEL